MVQASLMAQTVKNLPAMQETWVRSLGWEVPLEESMATYSSILAWKIPMDRGAWRATVHEVAESDTTVRISRAQHPGGPAAKIHAPNAGGPDLIPGQRIRSHMP